MYLKSGDEPRLKLWVEPAILGNAEKDPDTSKEVESHKEDGKGEAHHLEVQNVDDVFDKATGDHSGHGRYLFHDARDLRHPNHLC